MTSNPLSSDFSYKKYSLEQLDNWVHDALNCEDLTPQDIYNTIVKCVDESVEYHKKYLTKSIELLSLLKGHRSFNDIFEIDTSLDDIDASKKPGVSSATQRDWNDFWEETYYPEEYKQYTEEEMNAMCDKASSDQEKDKCREYNLREAEYYNKRAELDAKWKPVSVPSKPLYVSEDGDVWIPDTDTKEDKVVKWQLPIEIDGASGEYYIQFPDDLMEAAGIKENDLVQWIDRGDGTFELRKVTKPLGMDEC